MNSSKDACNLLVEVNFGDIFHLSIRALAQTYCFFAIFLTYDFVGYPPSYEEHIPLGGLLL